MEEKKKENFFKKAFKDMNRQKLVDVARKSNSYL